MSRFESFHDFPKLPLELRWEIWDLALPHRLIRISFQETPTKPSPLEWTPNKSLNHKEYRAHPAILSVNQESRDRALRQYILAKAPEGTAHFYFNRNLDTILLGTWTEGPNGYSHTESFLRERAWFTHALVELGVRNLAVFDDKTYINRTPFIHTLRNVYFVTERRVKNGVETLLEGGDPAELYLEKNWYISASFWHEEALKANSEWTPPRVTRVNHNFWEASSLPLLSTIE